jgi:putative CocE/NonD family hydrolase
MSATANNAVEVAADLLIPMRDGVRLAATLYRPRDGGPRPCLVNYLPYHKDGRGGLWYDSIHCAFAERGYASLVIDFRGLGCSEGFNHTPFDAQEGRDGHDAVEWAAAQAWCDGRVGMWGSSYGGITALKTAAEQPQHLRAIVPIHATADNYHDFLLLGGCRNGFWANGDWGPRMIGYNLTPPLGADADGRLARLWAERLEHAQPWCLDWYAAGEAARWADRAIPVEQIRAATLAVCGWHDFYVQGTLDYFQRLGAPKKLILGPWKHAFPNLSPAEPLNLLELMVRWWDRWLKGDHGSTDSGPPIMLFVRGSGVWRHEDSWPPRRNEPRVLLLQPDHILGDRPPVETARSEAYRHDPTVGLDSIGCDPWTTAVTDSGDHNGDDGRSLCFTTQPLDESWEVTGQARVVLRCRGSVPGFTYVAKLCDVWPDGRSRLVSMGWSTDPSTAADAVRQVEIPLRATSYLFPQGHRLRLGLALADFPRLWPTPQPGEIALLFNAASPARLLLPRTPPPRMPSPEPALPPPGPDLHSPHELEASQTWRVARELVRPTAALESRGLSRYQLRDGGTITYRHEYTACVPAADPAGASIEARSAIEVQRPTGTVVVKTVSVFTPTSVAVTAEIEENGSVKFSREWKRVRANEETSPG